MLEYYRGILFLTTNRLGTMDIAFQSRISLAVRYGPLTAEMRREIWLSFIQRLDQAEVEAKKQLIQHIDDLQSWDLNGRQIRNVLRMAQSIATSRGKRRGAMKLDHVVQVANETMRFQDYFDEETKESRTRLGDMNRTFKEKRASFASPASQGQISRFTNQW